ncbi:hypothetical protein L9F63_004417 [Diploptera punctata]|uniref:Cytosol aminopeptidase n=1 Tax=Diploptera punctata TaxID=6984 RepID=A0AAD8E7U1_DIPPU|nr:hypothetical protein L9F63_004417 [Diploptera punctata]
MFKSVKNFFPSTSRIFQISNSSGESITKRFQSGASSCEGEMKSATSLVLGVYTDESDPPLYKFTPSAQKYNEITHGKLDEYLKSGGPVPGKGEVRIFYKLCNEFASVALVGLGAECQGYNDIEERDDGKETIRIAAAVGSKALQDLKPGKLCIESFGHSESAAEGAGLGVWLYQDLISHRKRLPIPQLELWNDCDFAGWHIGLEKAAAQNLARSLMDSPGNMMTPTIFAQNAVEVLCKSGVNVEVKVQGWAETQKMGAFLSVSKGSCEPPIFLELSYYGAGYDERPIVLIGSGITFDSGGLCLKRPYDMLYMRGDMQGAAVVVATCRALALLQLPINIRGLIPLCENMPGCAATKPGDIVRAMNGKNILIENIDCEGRLVLADALYYSQNFWPQFVVDIGSLTKDIRNTMGTAATGVFTNSDSLWEQVRMAGVHTGDRMWRFPLWNYYTKQVTQSRSVDIRNVGFGPGGGACRAAAFLREFVPCGEWMHLDTFGVLRENGIDHPYLRKGMSGRPTRTLIEFLSALVCKCQ